MSMIIPILMTAKPIPIPTGMTIHMTMSTNTTTGRMMRPMTTKGITAAMIMIIPDMRRNRILILMIDAGKSMLQEYGAGLDRDV